VLSPLSPTTQTTLTIVFIGASFISFKFQNLLSGSSNLSLKFLSSSSFLVITLLSFKINL